MIGGLNKNKIIYDGEELIIIRWPMPVSFMLQLQLQIRLKLAMREKNTLTRTTNSATNGNNNASHANYSTYWPASWQAGWFWLQRVGSWSRFRQFGSDAISASLSKVHSPRPCNIASLEIAYGDVLTAIVGSASCNGSQLS